MKNAYCLIVVMATVPGIRNVAAQYTTSECSAFKSTSLANPAQLDTLRKVGSCSGYGSVYATLIGRYSLASDTATYGLVFDNATLTRDPTIFSTATAVAADGGAPVFARVGSLILLTNYGSRLGTLLTRSPVLTASGASFTCNPPELFDQHGGGVSNDPNVTMPSDYIAQSLALSRAIVNDGSAPIAVRYAASCLHTIALGDSIPSPSTYNPTFNPAHDFQLHSACSSTYLFRNLTPITVAVYITDTHTNVSRWISLPPRPSGATYSEETMKSTHGISVSYQGAVIATANPNTSC